MNRLVWSTLVVVAGLAFATPAQAQFRNQGIQGNVGYLGLGTLWDQALGPAWNIDDNLTLGAGHTLALGYNLWFDNTVALGGSKVRISRIDTALEPIFSLSISTGLRYTFLDEKFRPFIAGHIHYLQIIAVTENPPIPLNALLGSSPFWVGGRFGGGAEYFFADEMSLMLELGLIAFTGLNQSPCLGSVDQNGNCSVTQAPQSFVLPASIARLSYFVYF